MPAFDKTYRLLVALGYVLRIANSGGKMVAFLGIDVVGKGVESEIGLARKNLRNDLDEHVLSNTTNLNKNKFNSENTGYAAPPEIVFALNLPEDASLNDALVAIETLLDSRHSSNDLIALRDEIAALRKVVLHPEVDDTENDTDQIFEPSALYDTVDKDDVASACPVLVMELAAAGSGAEVLDETVTGQVAFRKSWLRVHGIDVKNSNVIGVKGESMEPTLPDGSSILVDKSWRRRQVDHIYVLRARDDLVAKRLDKDGRGQWQLISDHPAWPPVPWNRDTKVIGEVLWGLVSL